MNLFAEGTFHIVLHAEEVFTIGGISITNSMLLGWLVSAVLVGIFVWGAKRIKVRAGSKIISLIELLCELVINLTASTMHDRKQAAKYAPFLITIFCFILFNNWFGLLPGVGTITINGVPLFRAWTADLTGTLAISISAIVMIQFLALRDMGAKNHLKHYFSDKPYNPINFFVGLLEILGEFTRMASLALRLFGNIFAGEVLLVVLSAITSFGSPAATLPFIVMELFVGFIQAFVFTMLVIVYLTLAVAHHGEDSETASDHSVQPTPVVAAGTVSGG